MPDPGFGLYIHWPFCQSKCPYCDFNSHVWSRIDQDQWVDAYLKELDRAAAETSDRILRSVFFGGGTPSLMEGRTVHRILDRVRELWRFENDLEVTLEANPTSVEASRFADYRLAGVNRVSLGLQALNDVDLKRLGRLHTVSEGLAALDVAQNNFERVSFDLIYARQHQSLEDWEAELSRALGFDPSHMSLYQLTIEEGTAFGDRFARNGLAGLPSEDLGADLWDITQNLCNAAGLPSYEVSNHAKPGQESRHNLIYWNGGDYYGIGPGAHGRLTINGTRYATETLRAPGAWIAQVAEGSGNQETRETLSLLDVQQERLMMGLRLRDGVVLDEECFAVILRNAQILESDGFLTIDRNRVSLTDKGRPLLNAVLRQLLAD